MRSALSTSTAATPGYYNNEGRPEERSVRNANYGAGPVGFVRVLEPWRAQGSLRDLEFTAG